MAFARVEFLANLNDILALYEAGHSNLSIYEALHKEYKITMSYSSFCRYLRLYSKGNKTKHSPLPPPLSSNETKAHQKTITKELVSTILHGKKNKE